MKSALSAPLKQACIRFLSMAGGALLLATQPAHAEEDAWGGIRLFDADLSAKFQTVFTPTDGEGFATITFDINTMEIEWEIEHSQLSSRPVGVHLHGPAQPGTNAVQIVDLGTNGLSSPIRGKTKIPDAYAQYMLLGWTYVLLKTEQYPEGEIRGKVDTVPPPNYLEQSAKWGRGEYE